MIKKIQKNFVFKFLSSVKMAVPLMLLLGVVVAAGTLYESRYNAEVANIIVYKSRWFQLLLGLLWVNIFCAAVSRWPFKKHHTGFVITHIGLLTLLIGAQITAVQGIDGQLRVLEGEVGNTVFLTQNVVKAIVPGTNSVLTFPMERKFDRQSSEDFHIADFSKKTGVSIDQYLPFARRKSGGMQGSMEGSNNPNAVNLGFRLQSQFFDVQQMLNTESNAQLQMGPATLRLSTEKKSQSEVKPLTHVQKKTNGAVKSKFLVMDTRGQVLKEVSIADFKKGSFKINSYEIVFSKLFQSAMVDGGKVIERGGNENPAIEFFIKSGSQSLREISYEKFPNFSLRKNNTSGLSFKYESSTSVDTLTSNETKIDTHSDQSKPGGNLIEFKVNPEKMDLVHVVLSKNGNKVLDQTVKQGEVITTPWMGMKITILSSTMGSSSQHDHSNENQSTDIQEVEMVQKTALPSSAIYLRPLGGDVKAGAWLLEGESAKIQTLAGEVEVYYGMDSIDLPFKVKLEKFQKVNYPGTETPMSFQSTIRINEVGPATEIMMNEPMQYQGFTLYQSSFEQGPGIPTASIFSVNHDPGRWPKYIGAIILSLGIVIFTLMRSRWYQQKFMGAKA